MKASQAVELLEVIRASFSDKRLLLVQIWCVPGATMIRCRFRLGESDLDGCAETIKTSLLASIPGGRPNDVGITIRLFEPVINVRLSCNF